MSPAFVGFIIVAIVGAAAEMAVAFSAARKNRLDMSVSIALGSASQIALFVAPVLVLLSYVVGPTPMDLQFWPGAVTMMMIATVTSCFITNSGRSAWFVGALLRVHLRNIRHDPLYGAAWIARFGVNGTAGKTRGCTAAQPSRAFRYLDLAQGTRATGAVGSAWPRQHPHTPQRCVGYVPAPPGIAE